MAIPAVVVALVAVYYLLDYIFPRWRPKWTRSFITEDQISEVSELPAVEKSPSLRWVIALLTLVALGCAAEISLLLSGRISFTVAIQPFSWVSAPWPRYLMKLTMVFHLVGCVSSRCCETSKDLSSFTAYIFHSNCYHQTSIHQTNQQHVRSCTRGGCLLYFAKRCWGGLLYYPSYAVP